MLRAYKGKQLTGPEVQGLVNATRTAQGLTGRGCEVNAGPTGMSIRVPDPVYPDFGIITCRCSGAVEVLELVEIVDGTVSAISGEAICKAPTAHNLYRVGIAQWTESTGNLVKVRMMGVGLVKYAWAGGSTVDVGSLLGSDDADTLAVENMSGPLQVIEIAAHDAGWTGFNYALVKVGDSYGIPDVWKTTAAPGSGTVTAKRVNSSGTVQGNNFTFTVL